MRIYLDCCSIQRPFDNKSHPRIAVEAEAVLVIITLCEKGQLDLISSEVLQFEINRIPDPERREESLAILNIAKEMAVLSPDIEKMAERLNEAGIKPLDALHLATASISGADYFCTCDDRFLKKARNMDGLNIKVVSPSEFVMELDT